MNDRSGPDQATRSPEAPVHISGQDARGGEIILRTRRRRAVFLGGLIGIVLLVLIVRVAGLL